MSTERKVKAAGHSFGEGEEQDGSPIETTEQIKVQQSKDTQQSFKPHDGTNDPQNPKVR